MLTFNSSIFIGQSYFNNDGAQLYLIPQPLYYNLKILGYNEKVLSWKYKGLSVKNLPFLPLLIIVFLHQLNGVKSQDFFYFQSKLLKT